MKSKRVVYLLLVAALTFGLSACAGPSGLLGEAQPSAAVEATSTPEEAAAPERIFIEDFYGPLSGWRDYIQGEGDAADTSILDGHFVFEITSENTLAYTMYEDQSFADVALLASVENQGHENNYFSLVCRRSDDGWYEFNVSSDGSWAIQAYQTGTQSFVQLDHGASEAINQGLSSNEFSAVCQGDQLSLYANGELIATVVDNAYTDGYIGISVASFDNLPIRVAFDFLQVSQP